VFTNKDVFRAILYSDLDFQSAPWDHLSPAARDCVQRLLRRDPTKRPTAQEARLCWVSTNARAKRLARSTPPPGLPPLDLNRSTLPGAHAPLVRVFGQ